MSFNQSNLDDIFDRGYTIVEDVLSESELEKAIELFNKWQESIPNNEDWIQINPHGIYKFHEAGHQEHAWFIRTRKKVQEPFKRIWNTEELVVSFDGCCYMPKHIIRNDKCWMHSDQGPARKGLHCVQGMVALTSNKTRTIVVYEGTHKLHEEYCQTRNLDPAEIGDWLVIDYEMRQQVSNRRKVINLPASSMMLWDSRLFHENQYGQLAEPEKRIIQYICFLPKNAKENTDEMKAKRRRYFYEKRNTSHWPYPITVVPKQPRFYTGEALEIDYPKLREPNLSIYQDEINKII